LTTPENTDHKRENHTISCLLVTGGFSSNKGDAAILEASSQLFRDILVAADPALLLQARPSRRAEDFLQGLPDGPVLGIVPRR